MLKACAMEKIFHRQQFSDKASEVLGIKRVGENVCFTVK